MDGVFVPANHPDHLCLEISATVADPQPWSSLTSGNTSRHLKDSKPQVIQGLTSPHPGGPGASRAASQTSVTENGMPMDACFSIQRKIRYVFLGCPPGT